VEPEIATPTRAGSHGATVKPFFSVVIPTYNRAHELRRAIQSVLEQSFSDFEILVMDDGSTDNTCEVVARFNDDRITYEWDQNFGGPARPRNRGIAKAQGQWICFLDADDWWAPSKLRTCLQHISEAVDLLYHDLEIVRDRRPFIRRKKIKSSHVKQPVFMDLLMNGNAIGNSSVVVRRNLLEQIGGIDENVEMIACEDYNAWLRIAQVTEAFLYIPKSLGYYAVHENGISQKDMSSALRCAIAGFSSVLNQRQKCKLESKLRYLTGRFAYVSGDFDIAKENLSFALRHGEFKIAVKSILMLLVLTMTRHGRPWRRKNG